MCTLGSRGYFFLIDTDGWRRSRINEAQGAEEKELLISTGLFHLRYFEDGPLEPGCKCVVSIKKKEKKKLEHGLHKSEVDGLQHTTSY